MSVVCTQYPQKPILGNNLWKILNLDFHIINLAYMWICFLYIFRPEKISGALKTRWKNVGNSFLDLLNHWTLTKPELPCDFFSKAIPMSEIVYCFTF